MAKRRKKRSRTTSARGSLKKLRKKKKKKKKKRCKRGQIRGFSGRAIVRCELSRAKAMCKMCSGWSCNVCNSTCSGSWNNCIRCGTDDLCALCHVDGVCVVCLLGNESLLVCGRELNLLNKFLATPPEERETWQTCVVDTALRCAAELDDLWIQLIDAHQCDNDGDQDSGVRDTSLVVSQENIDGDMDPRLRTFLLTVFQQRLFAGEIPRRAPGREQKTEEEERESQTDVALVSAVETAATATDVVVVAADKVDVIRKAIMSRMRLVHELAPTLEFSNGGAADHHNLHCPYVAELSPRLHEAIPVVATAILGIVIDYVAVHE